jgi:hypothetical protein
MIADDDLRSTTRPIGIEPNPIVSSSPGSDDQYSSSITPRATPRKLLPSSSFDGKSILFPRPQSPVPPSSLSPSQEDRQANEHTPLLERNPTPLSIRSSRFSVRSLKARRPSSKQIYEHAVLLPKAIPAVGLGLLLNVLDGVSYGMITFPANAIFVDFGSVGVSMFFMRYARKFKFPLLSRSSRN